MRSGGWAALHPGGGGQIQDLTLDPSNPGTAYSLSDVDGLYKTTDYGETWEPLAAHVGAVLTLEVDPNDGDHLFMGTMRGLTESFDGGQTWHDVAGTTTMLNGDGTLETGLPVATIAFDPNDSDAAYFANSWLIKPVLYVWDAFGFNGDTEERNGVNADITHQGTIWRKDPATNEWEEVVFEPEAAYMNVYSIVVNPVDSTQIFVAASTGVYRSNDSGAAGSWEKLDLPLARDPAQAGDPHRFEDADTALSETFGARGIAISPDGERLYATFALDDTRLGDGVDLNNDGRADNGPRTALFSAANSDDVTWNQQSEGLYSGYSTHGGAQSSQYWNPTVDPYDDDVDHVLLGTFTSSGGLWLNSFDADGEEPAPLNDWARILNQSGRQIQGWNERFEFESGWDNYNIQARHNNFAPASWTDGPDDIEIWASGGQNIFVGTPGAEGWPYSETSWTERYSELIDPDAESYATRGIQSTVNWEAAAHDSYVVQAQSDNGIVESFDGGLSWSRAYQPNGSNARAVTVFDSEELDDPIVIAASGRGFGAGHPSMGLHVKVLETGTEQDLWIDNVHAKHGLPTNSYIYDITPGADGISAFIAFNNEGRSDSDGDGRNDRGGGVYFIDDVRRLFDPNDRTEATQIWNGPSTKVVIDPDSPDIVYALSREFNQGGRGDLVQLDMQPNGAWRSSVLVENVDDIVAWSHEGQHYIAATANLRSGGVSIGGEILLSVDGGESFTTVFTHEDLPAPPFDGLYGIGTEQSFSGLVGDGDSLYFATGLTEHRRGTGVFKADIAIDGGEVTVDAEEWIAAGEADHPDTRFRRADIIELDGVSYYAASGAGTGLWVKPLDDGSVSAPEAPPAPPADPAPTPAPPAEGQNPVPDSDPEPEPSPDPAPDPVPDADQAAISVRFFLVDAETDQRVAELSDGATVDPTLLSTGLYSVEAVPDDPQVGSIRLTAPDGSAQVENVAPYALFGNRGDDFAGTQLDTGRNTVSVELFAGRGGNGQLLGTASVAFTVAAEPVNLPPTFNAPLFVLDEDAGDLGLTIAADDLAIDPEGEQVFFDTVSESATGTTTLAGEGSILFFTPEPDFSGTVLLDVTLSDRSAQGTGQTTGTIEIEVLPTNDTPVVVDQPEPEPADPGETTFYLVNAKTDERVLELYDGAIVDAHLLDGAKFNLEATTTLDGVESAQLRLGDGATKTESFAPYALFGDKKGDFNGRALETGEHSISVDFFANNGGRGALLGSEAVTYTVVNSEAPGEVVFALNAGGAAQEKDGVAYAADTGVTARLDGASRLYGDAEGDILASERYGKDFGYDIALDDGRYDVLFEFAEIYFDTPGRRVFDVAVEGTTIIDDLDLVSTVGAGAVYRHGVRVDVEDGQLDIEFDASINNAKLSGLVVRKANDAPIDTDLTDQSFDPLFLG